MKMRQYDADDAGGYGDAVPVKPRFSKDCIIPGSGTKLRWQLECYNICREMQRHRVKEYNKQVGIWILFYSNHSCLRA